MFIKMIFGRSITVMAFRNETTGYAGHRHIELRFGVTAPHSIYSWWWLVVKNGVGNGGPTDPCTGQGLHPRMDRGGVELLPRKSCVKSLILEIASVLWLVDRLDKVGPDNLKDVRVRIPLLAVHRKRWYGANGSWVLDDSFTMCKEPSLVYAELSERLKEPVLKTGGAKVPVGSNPTLRAICLNSSVGRAVSSYGIGHWFDSSLRHHLFYGLVAQ